ncbi:MAG: tRNA (adenosine(37)-N6)-threonylcarbamoyltransferase complex dimerization subunit type 1 TsaB [Spirochaetales bacterium]|jgi:tRNA threonylcarbamoyladenosine biosynthesis protein TsaB
MNILVFDTSTDILAVGVAKDNGSMKLSAESGFRHSETLLPAIEGCLSESGLELKDIELIACTSGPGSFTGLRIGMSTAKGLSLALGIPWVGVPTLDCIAFGHEKPGCMTVPVLDARKNRLYAALYRGGRRVSEYLDISIAQLLALLDGEEEALFIGPDAEIFADYALERPGFIIETDNPENKLRGLSTLAELHYKEKGGASDDEGPLYLREPEIG